MLSKLLVTLPVSVILTFEDEDQAFYDADVTIPLVHLTHAELEALETDVVETIIKQAPAECSLDKLEKISLCYSTSGIPSERGTAGRKIIEFLTRNRAKYYFQPNQRDDYEQRIVDRTGVASKTMEVV